MGTTTAEEDSKKASSSSSSSLSQQQKKESKKMDNKTIIDLNKYSSLNEFLQEKDNYGLDILRYNLYLLGCKCHGTLEQRCKRLYLTKGLKHYEYPINILAPTTTATAGTAAAINVSTDTTETITTTIAEDSKKESP